MIRCPADADYVRSVSAVSGHLLLTFASDAASCMTETLVELLHFHFYSYSANFSTIYPLCPPELRTNQAAAIANVTGTTMPTMIDHLMQKTGVRAMTICKVCRE